MKTVPPVERTRTPSDPQRLKRLLAQQSGPAATEALPAAEAR